MNLLDRGAAMIQRTLKKHLSSGVTYRRGGQSTTLQATVGRTPFQVVDTQGMVARVESRDYLFDAAALVLGGVVVRPERGDTIVDSSGVYEVLPFGGEPHWRWSDAQNLNIRVHTKRIGDAP